MESVLIVLNPRVHDFCRRAPHTAPITGYCRPARQRRADDDRENTATPSPPRQDRINAAGCPKWEIDTRRRNVAPSCRASGPRIRVPRYSSGASSTGSVTDFASIAAICRARRTWCCRSIARSCSSTGASGISTLAGWVRGGRRRTGRTGSRSSPGTSNATPRHVARSNAWDGACSRSGSARSQRSISLTESNTFCATALRMPPDAAAGMPGPCGSVHGWAFRSLRKQQTTRRRRLPACICESCPTAR